MELKDLMGKVVEEIQMGLTGGTAELPLPANMKINYVTPGIPLRHDFFDFAIAGPFCGPTSETLDDFRDLVEAIAGDSEDDGEPMSREDVIEDAKRMYQQALLGKWEQWSRLVDFIPITEESEQNTDWTLTDDQGTQSHTGIVYGQAGQTLSNIYKDTLTRCWVAEEKLTPQQEKIIERMRKILSVTVETEDFLTGETVETQEDSPAMKAYISKQAAYENAAADYAMRLARSQTGTAQDVIEFQQSGGIYRQRALRALSDWQGMGFKNQIETAQSAIAHITGSNMVSWKQKLLDSLENTEQSTSGAFGYPFFPATVLPGSFARSKGWTKFSQRNLGRNYSSSSSSTSFGGRAGFNFGITRFGASGSYSKTEYESNFDLKDFGVEFEMTNVQICRPGFNPNFFASRGWKPKDSFLADYNNEPHSTGGSNPQGCFIGYPTSAIFVRNLTIYSRDIASFVKSKTKDIEGGMSIGIGPFSISPRYAQSDSSHESNYKLNDASIEIKGMQLIAFVSALFPACSNPNPEVKNWI